MNDLRRAAFPNKVSNNSGYCMKNVFSLIVCIISALQTIFETAFDKLLCCEDQKRRF